MFPKIVRKLFQKSPASYLPEFSTLFSKFQQILEGNNTVLEMIAQMEDKLSGEYIFDINYIRSSFDAMSETVYKIIYALNVLSNNAYPELFARYEAIHYSITEMIEGRGNPARNQMIVPNDEVTGEIEELVGDKSARLGDIRNHLRLNTPDGFVITTAAYHRFMTVNNMWPEIHSIYAKGRAGELSGAEQSRKISELFDKAALPSHLEREISQAASDLCRRAGRKTYFAVRSSARGEDGESRSFAGQFLTLLNQRREDISTAYKKVLLSRFSESAFAYQDSQDDSELELSMAVACQVMIPAEVSGVIYTIDPSGAWDRLLISAVSGLADSAVSGMADMDQYQVSRYHPFNVLKRRTEGQRAPALSDAQIMELTQAGLALERYFGQPQDIEWAIDLQGILFIVQSRPLTLQAQAIERNLNLTEALKSYPVLLADKGQVVQRGVAAGTVVKFREDDDPNNFPQGAIAVTHYTSPRLTKIIRRTSAIITDVGSPTGHMATIAREFRVPTIVGTGKATELLTDGMEITVDAEENRIYRGIVPEVLEYQMEGRDQFANLREFKLLKRILNRVTPLNLIDPTGSDFTAKNCKTFHDILRFCHEKAVLELINLQISEKRFRTITSRPLKLSIPIGLHIIDTGKGLSEDVGAKAVDSVEQVKSSPMRAILKGLTSPGTWSTEPRSMRFDDFMSSLTRFSLTSAQPQYTGQNLAVISDCYTNLSLRLGYHFNVIDTYVSENVNDNYIYFRFVGGVTEPDRRHRRGLLLQNILERYDFKVVLKNDLVVARLKKRSKEELLATLEMLGRLIGYTRQLDTEMTSDESVERYSVVFLEGDHPDSE